MVDAIIEATQIISIIESLERVMYRSSQDCLSELLYERAQRFDPDALPYCDAVKHVVTCDIGVIIAIASDVRRVDGYAKDALIRELSRRADNLRQTVLPR